MDFTNAFPHSSIDTLAFSPGSTFFALVVHTQAGPSSTTATQTPSAERTRKRRKVVSDDPIRSSVIIRASSTLQVVRSWELDGDITSLQWSAEGRFLLAVSPSYAWLQSSVTKTEKNESQSGTGTETGVAYVLSLDPSLEANDGSDEGAGWVARVDAGLEGLISAQWLGSSSSNIIMFSQHSLRATIYDLKTLRATIVSDVKSGPLLTSAAYPEYFCLLRRTACKEQLTTYRSHQQSGYRAIMEGKAGQSWEPEQSFSIATNDARGASWSDDGKFFAVWEGHMEYKVLVYTRCGTLRFTFYIPPGKSAPVALAATIADTSKGSPLQAVQPKATAAVSSSLASSTSSSEGSSETGSLKASKSSGALLADAAKENTKPKRIPSGAKGKQKADDSDIKVADGGLGVKSVSWAPSGNFLAVGGFDEKIRLLDVSQGAEVCVLDLSRAVIAGELSHNRQLANAPYKPRPDLAFGRLQVWREPSLSWIEATGKRTIISMECSTKSLPVTVPTMRVDMGVATPKCGICWMGWNKSGTLLASRNENMPTAVFIHAFPPVPRDRADQTPRPYLVAALLYASAVRSVTWQPDQPCALNVACGGQAVYTWALALSEDGESIQQMAEAIPIPNDFVNAHSLKWAPDGTTLLVADKQSFCCAIAA